MKNHRIYEEMLLLYFHDELNPGDQKIILRHLETCSACRQELDSLGAIKNCLAIAPRKIPTKTLIERVNQQVMCKISRENKSKILNRAAGWLESLRDSVGGAVVRPRYLLVSIGITFVIGMFVGKLWLSSGLQHDPNMLANFVNYQASMTNGEKEIMQKALANYLIQSGGIEVADLFQGGKDQDGDGVVEVNVKIEKDLALKGGLDDPTILNMLRYSALHNTDKARRLRALKLLSQTPKTLENESTIIAVLLNSGDPDLRIRAFDYLNTYEINSQIMDTYKTLALRDSSDTIRTIALEQLHQNADDSVIPILALIASSDSNSKIRDTAQKYLNQIAHNSKKTNQQE
jgi:hypothetical protein